MYILKAKYHNNVIIKDMGINVLYDDDNGVLVDRELFEKSKDAQAVLDKLIVIKDENDFSMTPDKNVILTELDLPKIQNPKENMTVFVKNYMNTGDPAYAIFIEGEWKFFAVNGEDGSYVHPISHPATMIVQDSTHRFVSDAEKLIWNSKSDFGGNYNDLLNKPTFANIAFSGDYNDLLNKPTESTDPSTLALVATSGSYNDLLDKPNVYSKDEVNTLVTSSIGVVKYEPTGSTNKDCIVTATGLGIKFVKLANKVTLTVPEGINILSVQLHFSNSDIGSTGNCSIDYGMGTSYTDMTIPTFQVLNDVEGSRAYKLAPFPAANFNTNAHTLQLTGLAVNTAAFIKLTF